MGLRESGEVCAFLWHVSVCAIMWQVMGVRLLSIGPLQ